MTNNELEIFKDILANIEIDNDIVVIADLGLWNGRIKGYKILNSPISILTDIEYNDYFEIYIEDN